jgi:pimeloyl-ACP methyl ester carboxylesterase
MPSVRAGEVEIAYLEVGSGGPVLFINGTALAGADWLAQTGDLADDYRCILPDNRDIGSSTYVGTTYTPATMAADMAAVVDALDVGAVPVVGFSLGGVVAQELALARPDRVRSLVLMGTWPESDPAFIAVMRGWQALRRGLHDDEEAFLRAISPWVWSPATYAAPGLIDGLIELGLAREPRQPPEAFSRQCEADIAHAAGERLRQIAVPVLVIVGEHDITTPPRYARRLCEAIPNAALRVIADAAHMVGVEQAAVVNEAIRDFLRKH